MAMIVFSLDRLSFVPARSAFLRARILKQVARLTIQRTTQFAQNVGSKHRRPIMVQAEQSGIRDSGLLSQAVQRPTFTPNNLCQPANDHVSSLTARPLICQVCFTCMEYHSSLRRFHS